MTCMTSRVIQTSLTLTVSIILHSGQLQTKWGDREGEILTYQIGQGELHGRLKVAESQKRVHQQ